MNKHHLICALLFGASAFGGSLIQDSQTKRVRPSLSVAPAQAFGGLGEFELAAFEGGGGGRYFTGSLRDGFTCGVCHQSQTFFGMELRGLDGSIVPGKTYTLTVSWDGEPKRVSLNGEVVGPKGFAAGQLSQLDGEIGIDVADKKDKRQIFNVYKDDARAKSQVKLKWTAPDKSFKGPISLHLAAVRFPEPDPDAKQRPSALENTEQAIFSAIVPFGEAGSKQDAKQGEQE